MEEVCKGMEEEVRALNQRLETTEQELKNAHEAREALKSEFRKKEDQYSDELKKVYLQVHLSQPYFQLQQLEEDRNTREDEALSLLEKENEALLLQKRLREQ